MVLYPQLYSTVNQNQIHLHLHATASSDKIEQYLGSATAMDVNAATTVASVAAAVPLALMGGTDGGSTGVDRGEIGTRTSSSEGGNNNNSTTSGTRNSRTSSNGQPEASLVDEEMIPYDRVNVTEVVEGGGNNRGQTRNVDGQSHALTEGDSNNRDAIATESVWRPY